MLFTTRNCIKSILHRLFNYNLSELMLPKHIHKSCLLLSNKIIKGGGISVYRYCEGRISLAINMVPNAHLLFVTFLLQVTLCSMAVATIRRGERYLASQSNTQH